MSNVIKQLKRPFPADEINWRVQSCGISNGRPWAMVLAYIDARAVMDRLDKVVGPFNWQDEINSLENGKTFCKLSVRINDEWITKTGVAGETNIEAAKGGASDALKRAAVKFGIARYLYQLDEDFADCTQEKKRGDKWHKAKTKSNDYIYWKEPQLPGWALPGDQQDKQKLLDQVRELFQGKNSKIAQGAATDELKSEGLGADLSKIPELPADKLQNIINEVNK